MKGVQEYNQNIKDSIDNYLDKHKRYERVVRSFLNYLGTDKSLNTKYQYAREATHFLEWGDEQLGKTIPELIEDLNLNYYVDYLALFEDKTNSYRTMIYASLTNFSEYLLATEQCSDDYMKRVKAPKGIESQETVEKREHGFLDEVQIKDVLNNIKEGVGNKSARTKQSHWFHRDIFLVAFMIANGPRVSAVEKMDVEDIHVEDNMTSIVTTEKRGKVRKYYLNDDLRMLLEEYLEFRNEYLGETETNALFISNRKERMRSSSIRALVRKYTENVKKISPHKLRATYATQLYKQTHDIYFVQQGMGHSSPSTTNRYIRGEVEDIRKKSVDIMSNLMFNNTIV